MKSQVNPMRIRQIKSGDLGPGPVVYWMSRDQRLNDNWALLQAQEWARQYRRPLVVVFCLAPDFLGATWRQYNFMLQGLKQLELAVARLNIGFQLLCGDPIKQLPAYLRKNQAAILVNDFSPLKISITWQEQVAKKIIIPIYQVDAHNIIPAWILSEKQEYAARTIRPKVHQQLAEFLTNFPTIKKHPHKIKLPKTNWLKVQKILKIDKTVSPVKWLESGETAAVKALKYFINHKLADYHLQRNNPTTDGQSDLSPYFHFGHLSPQRAAWEVNSQFGRRLGAKTFIEEAVVRRELAENFCLYNCNYDSLAGAPAWAQKTLAKHKKDHRPYVYTCNQLEQAQTHDQIWNAVQRQMVQTGKMHGYLRMYWAKKILEWSKSPSEAVRQAVYLNDKYELDGRDPNGYVGVLWSIAGLHDRPWSERPIFGTIRYMSEAGIRRKFKIDLYLKIYQ